MIPTTRLADRVARMQLVYDAAAVAAHQSTLTMLLAQISDMHITRPGQSLFGVVDTAALLKQCVAKILALTPLPEAVLATGDLTDAGSDEDYAHLRELLAPLRMPVYVIPGNHDHRERMLAAFSDQPWLRQLPRFIQYVIDDWPVRLIALDSVVPGKPGGELCAARLDWLEQTLAKAPTKPTVIMVHHAPITSFIGWMDTMGLASSSRFEAIVRANPQIERILGGHFHRAIQMRWAGTLVSIAPSTAHQVTLDLGEGAPQRYVMEPPAFQLHRWSADTGMVTHTAYCGDFGPARPYREL